MKKYFLDTEGCFTNRINEPQIKTLLEKNGWTPSNSPQKADIIIYSTCAYTKRSEDHTIDIIKRYKKIKAPKAKLIIGGCLPDINKRRMRAHFKGPYFTPLTLPSLCKIINAKYCTIDNMSPAQPISSGKRKELCIRIGYGCLNRCSFCAINKVFPKLISKSRKQIVEEFKLGLKNRYKKFVLTGEDISVYGLDIGTNLIELLKDLLKIKTRKKISILLYRLNPQWLLKIGSEIIEILKSKKINFLSISIQSGSNRILKLMNRRYDINEIKKYIKKIKKDFPFIRIHLDFIVGFPGETEKDFQKSIKFVSETNPDDIMAFQFTERPGTKAKYLDKKVPQKIIEDRAKRLNKVADLSLNKVCCHNKKTDSKIVD